MRFAALSPDAVEWLQAGFVAGIAFGLVFVMLLTAMAVTSFWRGG